MSQEWNQGQVLYTLDGEPVTVADVISKKGGQGVVYRVRWNGREYALKWHHWCTVGNDQYKSIEKLTRKPAPSPDFIWPLKIVTETGSADDGAHFGYLIELCPEGCCRMEDYLRTAGDLQAVSFQRDHALVAAALNIVANLRSLHLQGMSYKEMDATNFIIHPATGAVKVVNNDNVAADGPGGGEILVRGTPGYVAPEIVRSQYRMVPNINSDLYLLAVILFRLFYIDRPVDDATWVYCMHPTDTSNRPDDTHAPNVKVRWNDFPAMLHKDFERTFVEGIEHPESRTTTHAWMKSLSALRDRLVYYYDPKENRVDRTRECFVDFDDLKKIPAGCLRLKVGVNQVALYPEQSLYANTITNDYGKYRKEVGRVLLSSDGRMGLQNRSNGSWIIENRRAGTRSELAPRGVIELCPGLRGHLGQVVGVVDNPRSRYDSGGFDQFRAFSRKNDQNRKDCIDKT